MARCLWVVPVVVGGRVGEVQRRRVVPGAAVGAVWPCGPSGPCLPEGLAEAWIPVLVPVAASRGPLAVVRGAVAEDGGCLDPGPGPPGPTRLAGSGPGGRIRGGGGHRAPGRVGDEK